MFRLPAPLLSLALVILHAGCGAPRSSEPSGPGTLTAQWTGSQAGRFAAPAEARWCARDSLLELTAARADTGIGLALFPPDTLVPGDYPVYSARLFTAWRPQANVAVRWLGATDLLGFEGASGQAAVTAVAGGRVSGRFEARLLVPGGTDSLRLAGRFEAVPVVPSPEPCGRTTKPAGA